MPSNKLINFKLSNGLRVVYLHKKSAVAHFGLSILAGSRFEKSNEIGLAHFLEHCLFKGTKKRKAYHVLSRLDSVGGELNAYTSKEELCLYASFSKKHTKRAIELIADISCNSVFPKNEIEKEKEIIFDEINSYMDSPIDKIFDDFEELMFPNHPLGNNILGSKETLKEFDTDMLNAYLKRFLNAQNCVLSFVGDTPIEQLKKSIEKEFSVFSNENLLITPKPFFDYKPFNVSRKEANYQTHFIIGSIAPGIKETNKVGLSLLINLLGGPALNSRLTLSIREKHGYAYNIEANYTPYLDIGFWTIYVGCDKKHLKKCIKLVKKELETLCKKELSITQLNNAKEQMKGHIALNMDSNVNLMLNLGKSMLVYDKAFEINEIHQEIDCVNSGDLKKIANDYLHPSNCSSLIFDLK